MSSACLQRRHIDLDASFLNEEAKRFAGMQRSQGRWSVDELGRRLRETMSAVRIVRDEQSLRVALNAIAEGESALRTVLVVGRDDVQKTLELENMLLVVRLAARDLRRHRTVRESRQSLQGGLP